MVEGNLVNIRVCYKYIFILHGFKIHKKQYHSMYSLNNCEVIVQIKKKEMFHTQLKYANCLWQGSGSNFVHSKRTAIQYFFIGNYNIFCYFLPWVLKANSMLFSKRIYHSFLNLLAIDFYCIWFWQMFCSWYIVYTVSRGFVVLDSF